MKRGGVDAPLAYLHGSFIELILSCYLLPWRCELLPDRSRCDETVETERAVTDLGLPIDALLEIVTLQCGRAACAVHLCWVGYQHHCSAVLCKIGADFGAHRYGCGGHTGRKHDNPCPRSHGTLLRAPKDARLVFWLQPLAVAPQWYRDVCFALAKSAAQCPLWVNCGTKLQKQKDRLAAISPKSDQVF